MLTFFEYLRQRAFESVLAGAQEALELLEDQKTFERSQSAPTRGTASKQVSLGFPSPENSAEQEQSNDLSADPIQEESLPAPRRRGRPKKKAPGDR